MQSIHKLKSARLKNLCLCLTVMGLSACSSLIPSEEQPSELTWKKTNQAVYNQVILKGYQELKTASIEMAEKTQAECQKEISERAGATLLPSFNTLMQRWQSVQALRFGPIEENTRFYRVQLWPDKRGSVGKHLGKLINELKSDASKTMLDQNTLAKRSVAVQGLPALERILTNGKTLDGKQCEILLAITQNIRVIANNTLTAWQGDEFTESYGALLFNFDYEDEESPYKTDADVSAKFLGQLLSAAGAIPSRKLSRAIGQTANDARAKRLESWRSQQSLKNIKANLKSLEALYHLGFLAHLDPLDPTLSASVSAQFEVTQKAAADINMSLYQCLENTACWEKAKTLENESRKLSQSLAKLPKVLGLSIGFNALDGD